VNIDHINISAPLPLLEQVRDFYCAIFGLEDGFRPAFSRRGFWLYAEDRALIHLIESEDHFASEQPGYLDHVAFRLTGLAGLIARLDARAVQYRLSQRPELGMTQVFFTDPAGTGLEANFIGEFPPAAEAT
jgi:catechol 2,3-dioxygenase-like lactoylglutathione lyase family enzyme